MKKYDLGKDKISRLLLAFSIPCVISSLINSIYNIVDQVFIGKGVGTLGNAATNVLFPLVVLMNATAGLIGNGSSANMSLKMGEGKHDEASKSVSQCIILAIIAALTLSGLAYIFLPKLIYFFGCTDNVYPYALAYGRIIVAGMPFMLMYSALSNIIRADGSPRYSMAMLVTGAIINIILDPLFIFGFHMGVKGGALATIIGQFISFLIAIRYLFRIKSVKLKKENFKLDKNVFKILSLGLSSFITQSTILVLYIFMNNIMTKLGALSHFGADIPLSAYGVMSKVNSLFISTVVGISIGAQPIIGFNYGAGNGERVREALKKVLIVNFSIGIFFNILFFLFPTQIANLFITEADGNYELFMEFVKLMCHSFLLLMSINALEITTSVLLQALGKVFKATMLAFSRQILMLIPISLLLGVVLKKGIYGVLYAGLIADVLCFIMAIFVFRSEYVSLSKARKKETPEEPAKNNKYQGKHVVITISREYGSGGHFVGQMVAEKLGINFYDKALISLTAKESGLSSDYIETKEEKKQHVSYANNNDDRIFIAEKKVILDLAKKESCVIVGRCADYILKDDPNTIKIFLYSDMPNKINRVVKYYGISKTKAKKVIEKENKERARHYKYYTEREWQDLSNYDLMLDVDEKGPEMTTDYIIDYIKTH